MKICRWQRCSLYVCKEKQFNKASSLHYKEDKVLLLKEYYLLIKALLAFLFRSLHAQIKMHIL